LRKYSPTKLCDSAEMAIFKACIFSEPRAVHLRDLHSKFALRRVDVW